MKKIFSFAMGTMLLISSLSAQITLTGINGLPQVGDNFTYIRDLSPTFAAGPAGANQSWDFTSAGGDTLGFFYVALNDALEPGNFPDADIVETDTIGSGENYYSTTDSSRVLEGQYIPGVTRVTYTDKREFLQFPITYNDVFTETFSGPAENLVSMQTFDRSGTVEIKADGYGSLVLPYGTVDDVLRIASIYDYSDQFGGIPLFSYNDTIYTWFHAGTNNFIASYSVAYVSGVLFTQASTYISQKDLMSTGIEVHPLANSIRFFPNPASDQVQFENSGEPVEVRIFDLQGRLIKTFEAQPGMTTWDSSQLIQGLYVVEYAIDGRKPLQEKLMIR